jgi:hypothetical protein
MMTAPSPSLERTPDPITRAQADATGWDSPYTADSAVRYYQTRTIDDWRRDTGDQAERVEIIAGIGVLVLDQVGARFTPRGPATPPPPPPEPAGDELYRQRVRVCCFCDHADGHLGCQAGGCRCAREGRPELLTSRCPLRCW